ncbi:MAG TPA: glycerate kinase, partial [Cyclobacteriaceae bacterium]|nr:glycerate kinase [Cyclobacteriaceae bacterium]
MTILIAPDKFKGSLSAKEVCEAVYDGLIKLDPSLSIISVPLADGGEGTYELLTTN